MGKVRATASWGLALASWLILWSVDPSRTLAQPNPTEVVQNLNRDAMEAYNALEIDKAGALLEEALRVAQRGGVTGPLLAETHMNLGVVHVGGMNDKDGGFAAFVAALCINSGSQLDPLNSTPDIQSVFSVAVQKARAGACQGGAEPPPASAPAMTQPPMGPPPVDQPPPDQALAHVAPVEQVSQTPLPLYVEVNPMARAHEIDLYYRGLGMDTWKRVPMYKYKDGYAYQISCNDVWEPKVSYYIEAKSAEGQVVGVVASAAQPIEVPVVAARRQAEPALPGAKPPSSCVARECPPGVVGCKQPGKAAIDAACESNSDCQSGLECTSDRCALIGGGGTTVSSFNPQTGAEEVPHVDKPEDFKKTFIEGGLTLGLTILQNGMITDRSPPNGQVFVDQFGNWVPAQNLTSTSPLTLPTPANPAHLAALAHYPYIPDADSGDSGGLYGGGCAADGTKTGPGNAATGLPPGPGGLLPSRYCVRLKNPGVAPALATRVAIGHFFTPRLALAVILRFQFSAGLGTFSHMLLGARGEYLLTKPAARGLMASLFVGGTFGQIQAKPPATGDTKNAPFVISGLFGAHAGAKLRYRVVPNFGFVLAPEFDAQLPTLLFNIDVTGGVEAAF